MVGDLRDLSFEGCGQMISYVDDLLICSTEELGCKHIIQILNFLIKRGFKVSKNKVQILQQRVEYLGLMLSSGKRMLSSERIQAILDIPESTTQRQLWTFLGLTEHSRFWTPTYGKKSLTSM